MNEQKLTYNQVVEKYGFNKMDIDKIMARTQPQTEVDGIRILMKEGERRLKLKQAYADRMAKQALSVNESVTEIVKDSPFAAATKKVIKDNTDSILTKDRDERVEMVAGPGLAGQIATLEAEDSDCGCGTGEPFYRGKHPTTGEKLYK